MSERQLCNGMRIIADIYALKMFIAKLQTCFIAYDEIVILLMGDNVFFKPWRYCSKIDWWLNYLSNNELATSRFFRASYIARVVNLEKASYKVQIWDTAGQEQVSFLKYLLILITLQHSHHNSKCQKLYNE